MCCYCEMNDNGRTKPLISISEVVSCDFCGEDIEGKLATAKVREMGVEPKEVSVRLYSQIFFCWGKEFR